MPVPCMPVRPLCVVISSDLHGALGTLIAPPAPPVPFTPSDVTLWIAASTTYYGVGDAPVETVLFCNSRAVNKGADSKWLRPHVVVVGVVLPNVVVGPIIDLGFIVLVIAVGATKPVWGPTTVKAGGKSVAVMALPYSPISPYNQLVCTDPCDMPIGLGLEFPTSVFVGMTLADYVCCLVSIAVDMFLSFVLNLVFGGFRGTSRILGRGFYKAVMRRLLPSLRGIAGKGLSKLFDAVFERVAKAVAKKFGQKAGDAVGRLFSKVLEEGSKKGAGTPLGGLSPDDLLGFGEDPPIWAR